ncbi:DNA polymerase IV [Nocardioides sp. zg-536]|uniref:DNA polymerase IV n=1 Tax=Nocardioides faecalis TaxID=2803858 RepID=A0A938Y9E0_9ACTN|nr:DNA polymerase IV [Nocardioides faecalis]MBM9460553.1 DNA polymerase IV [Nocardioides faecalis]QVI60602.1 DNA polymerase IV [Nocardioides faecalis]
MRAQASVLHLDLDAFFAAVEQRDKPSLRGKPVVVGGVGGRGVVATASYEARAFGVRSAMSTREARARCPHAAYLSGRFEAYRAASEAVMGVLRSCSPLVEPLSLDEAFVDLEQADLADLEVPTVTAFAEDLRRRVREVTGGLTASVGVASSKFLAKVASDLRKPDGLFVVAPGTELELLHPMHVKVIPGVGPATVERLRRAGVHTVADLARLGEDELVRVLGRAQGQSLFRLARARDDRAVVPDREAKSVSVEGTYEHDVTDRDQMEAIITRQAADVARRLQGGGLSGRTVTLKVRLYDFTTLSRSSTLDAPTESPAAIARVARGLLRDLDTSGGVRLLGVGVSGLADWVQEDLFGTDAPEDAAENTDKGADEDTGHHSADAPDSLEGPAAEQQAAAQQAAEHVLPEAGVRSRGTQWSPGLDVVHAEHGRGWVWGAGRGVVTVRFETAQSSPGPVRSFRADDPALSRWRPPDSEEPQQPGRARDQ